MTTTITRNADGSVTKKIETVQTIDGKTVTNSAQWDIQPHQVDAHRAGDPSIDAATDPATLAALNKDKTDRQKGKGA